MALVNDSLLSSLKCPDPQCDAVPTQRDMRDLLQDDDYLKYLNRSLVLTLRDDISVRWCPAPDCGCPFELGSVCSPFDIVQCPSCLSRICLSCSALAHPGSNCSGQQDAYFSTWLSVKGDRVKFCPLCKCATEKNLGMALRLLFFLPLSI